MTTREPPQEDFGETHHGESRHTRSGNSIGYTHARFRKTFNSQRQKVKRERERGKRNGVPSQCSNPACGLRSGPRARCAYARVLVLLSRPRFLDPTGRKQALVVESNKYDRTIILNNKRGSVNVVNARGPRRLLAPSGEYAQASLTQVSGRKFLERSC